MTHISRSFIREFRFEPILSRFIYLKVLLLFFE